MLRQEGKGRWPVRSLPWQRYWFCSAGRHSGHVYVGCERKPFGAQDGGGAWNTLSPNNWWNGNADVGWPGGTNGAIFGAGSGTAGTVTIGPTGVSVGAVTFNAPGVGTYTIAGCPITLANSPLTFTMNANASISAVLSGNGGLTETGGNSLQLAASNTYSGPTTVSFAILRLSNSAALPSGNLTLDGGLLELAAGGFTRSVGGGLSQVQFTANGGGFSAIGANRIVNLGGSGHLDLGQQRFPAQRRALKLGTTSADSMIDFQNPLVLSGGTQTILVTAGSGTANLDARLSGSLSGSGGLIVRGDGTLDLTANNTYTGPTTVSGIVLRLSNTAALSSGNVTLDGGILELAAGDFAPAWAAVPTKCNSRATAAAFQPRGPTAR